MATNYNTELAKDYANKWSHDTPRRSMIYYTWRKSCGDVNGLRIADLACGSGATSRMLAENGAEVVGIDLSSHQLKYALEEEEKKPLGIKYYQADIRDAGTIPDVGSFDLVTPTFLFNYAQNISELKNMSKSCNGLLRSHGKICAITINPFNPTEKSIDGEGADVKWVDSEKANQEGAELEVQLYDEKGNPITPFVTHFFSAKVYEEALNEAGFVDIKWTPLEMNDASKKSFSKWKELEKGTSVIVFTANKRE